MSPDDHTTLKKKGFSRDGSLLEGRVGLGRGSGDPTRPVIFERPTDPTRPDPSNFEHLQTRPDSTGEIF